MSSTHKAVVTPAIKAPLQLIDVPTVAPEADEVLLRVEWTGSTPLDLHMADGGLLTKHPAILGSSYAGTVQQVGPTATHLKVGDVVFGFGFGVDKQKAHQELATVPEYLLGKIPAGVKPEEAVTLPTNFVTVFNTMYRNFDIPLPWPKPADYVPPHATDPFFVWGASSSVGQYTVQILRYYGFKHILAAASARQHAHLRELGATHVFDYRAGDLTAEITAAAKALKPASPSIPFVIDCIGSSEGTLTPINKFAEPGTHVAAMLPVITKHASDADVPEFLMDPQEAIAWKQGVRATGVRTHFYLENAFLKHNAQSVIMPEMLAQGLVKPNKVRIIEGKTLLERATNALNVLRGKDYSGQKLVWRVSE